MAFSVSIGTLAITTPISGGGSPSSALQGAPYSFALTANGGSGGNIWTVLNSTGGDTWVMNGNLMQTTPGQGFLSTEPGNNLATEAGNLLVS